MSSLSFPNQVWLNAIRLDVSPIAAIVKVSGAASLRRRSKMNSLSVAAAAPGRLRLGRRLIGPASATFRVSSPPAAPALCALQVDDTADGVAEGITAGCWAVGLARSGNYSQTTNISRETQRAVAGARLCFSAHPPSASHSRAFFLFFFSSASVPSPPFQWA